MSKICIYLVKFYKYLISPMLPNACRYLPTCSDYMIQAIKAHGVMRGVWLGAKRVSKCHPFSSHGIDEVPDK